MHFPFKIFQMHTVPYMVHAFSFSNSRSVEHRKRHKALIIIQVAFRGRNRSRKTLLCIRRKTFYVKRRTGKIQNFRILLFLRVSRKMATVTSQSECFLHPLRTSDQIKCLKWITILHSPLAHFSLNVSFNTFFWHIWGIDLSLCG